MGIELKKHQASRAKRGAEILKKLGLVCLFMQPRTGKTYTALALATEAGFKKALFITTKKASADIEKQVRLFGQLDCEVWTYGTVQKADWQGVDIVIIDEVHKVSAFPKPGATHNRIKKLAYGLPQIHLSGTPCPESYSQFYHIFALSKASPFPEKTFYHWARKYVEVTQIRVPYGLANDYKKAKKELFYHLISPFIITCTQEEAGYVSKIKENFVSVETPERLFEIKKAIEKHGVYEGGDFTIVADSSASRMQKVHQIVSGTVKQDDEYIMLSKYKAQAIKEYFAGGKVVIFYKYIAELSVLKAVFGDLLTTDIEEFKRTNKSIALQFVAGREGLTLAEADHLAFFNIDFSAVSYFQARERISTFARPETNVYWFFSKTGFEEKVYNAVSKKKNYTLSIYKKDVNI